MERVDTDSYHSFKFYMKGQVLELCQKECIIVNCYVYTYSYTLIFTKTHRI